MTVPVRSIYDDFEFCYVICTDVFRMVKFTCSGRRWFWGYSYCVDYIEIACLVFLYNHQHTLD